MTRTYTPEGWRETPYATELRVGDRTWQATGKGDEVRRVLREAAGRGRDG